MNRKVSVAALMLMAASVWGADFETGQAARAVIGQISFSAHESGITPVSLALAGNRLYVADASRQVLTFDLAQIPGPKVDLAGEPSSGCALCGFSALSSVSQSVPMGVAAAAVFGRTVVIADSHNGRVLIWRDTSQPRSAFGADVMLGGADKSNISASTLIQPISAAYDGKRLFIGDGALHRVLVWNSLPVTDNQPADVVLGQQSFASVALSDTPGPDTINDPTALVSDGTNLYVGDARDHRVLIFTAGDAALSNAAVVNSATSAPGPLAPGTLVTINGTALADYNEPAKDDGDAPLPQKLGGVEIFVNGNALPLLSVSPSEIRAQVLYRLAASDSASLYIRTQHTDGSITVTNAIALKTLPATPGLFAFPGTEPRAGMVLHAGSNSQPATPVTAENPAQPGEVLIIWATGLGAVESATQPVAGVPFSEPDARVVNPVEAQIGNEPAEVLSARLPQGAIGIYQIRVVLPSDLESGPDTHLFITQAGRSSNAVTFPVANTVQ